MALKLSLGDPEQEPPTAPIAAPQEPVPGIPGIGNHGASPLTAGIVPQRSSEDSAVPETPGLPEMLKSPGLPEPTFREEPKANPPGETSSFEGGPAPQVDPVTQVDPAADGDALEASPTPESAPVLAVQEETSPPQDTQDVSAPQEASTYEGLFQSRHPAESPLPDVSSTFPAPSTDVSEEPSDPWQNPEDAPRTYSRGFVWLAMALTFGIGLGIGLMTWVFSVALREDIPSSPELRRLAMENTALSQSLDRQSVELEAQQKKADDEDRRLRREWSIVVDEIEALEREQDKAMERAQSLNDRLEIFVRRNDAVAQQVEHPEDIRRQASALRDEGTFYRNALDGEMGHLEDEKQRFRGWILRLEEQMKTRRVRGVAVRIIHDALRRDDADSVAKLLNAAGADAHLFVTDITQTETHKGRIYYHGKAEEEAARQIARMVRTIEPIEAESIGVTNPFLSLWIVGEGPGQLDSLSP